MQQHIHTTKVSPNSDKDNSNPSKEDRHNRAAVAIMTHE
jgi:hypothetical protein